MGIYYFLYTMSDAEAQELIDHPDKIRAFVKMRDANYNVPTFLSLEKCWHGIHFGLTRTAWEGEPPLNFLMAGELVGDIDLGFGPARILFADEVVRINKALTAFTDVDFDQNFDLAAMEAKEIYPQIWDRSRQELLAEYLSFLQSLRSFIHYAAVNNQAVVMTVK